MVAYNFKERFRLPILTGTKDRTIRSERKSKRHARPGEEVQLYTGSDLICRPRCRLVEPITLRLRPTLRLPCSVERPSTSEFYSACALDAFARSDGFDDWPDLVGFWDQEHPGVEIYTGVLIMWWPLSGAVSELLRSFL